MASSINIIAPNVGVFFCLRARSSLWASTSIFLSFLSSVIYSFLNPSYHILDRLSSLLLGARRDWTLPINTQHNTSWMLSPRCEDQWASWLLSRIPISLTDPRSIGLKPSGNCLPVDQGLTGITLPIDQGSVLAVRVFGSLSIYFTPQPEVVPAILSFLIP